MMCLFNATMIFTQSPKALYKQAGFSLIELMVVMAIMAVLMSLSGGLMQKSINQQARQVELEQVSQLFKKLSYKAYYGGGAINVRLENQQMQLSNPIDKQLINDENNSIEYIEFDELVFVAQDYTISAKGIISPNTYQVFWQQEIKEFPLKSLFGNDLL